MRYFFSITLAFFLSAMLYAQDYKIDNHHLVLPCPIEFEAGGYEIKSSSLPALKYIKSYLEAKTYITLVRIEAHVGRGGDREENARLTQARSLMVAAWLIENGIDCKRLICAGFGESKPVADNSTPEGRTQNTRIEIHNAALRDRNIGGMPVDGGGIVPPVDLCDPDK